MSKINNMDSFICYGDYKAQIQADNLLQVIGNNFSVLDSIQKAAVEECASYLKNKYDISKALQTTPQHDKTKTYKAGQTVYLNAPDYMANKSYSIDDLSTSNGNVYVCTTATNKEPFTISHWSLIGLQYSTYYVITPNDTFNYKNYYKKGDVIFWNDKIYTALLPSQLLDHQALLNINQAVSSALVNVFPDDSVQGIQYWGVGEPYSVPADTEITDTTFWIQGDNRDQKLLQICIDIAIYHAHARISPRNIPELRTYRYIGNEQDRLIDHKHTILYPVYSALGWLQAAMKGDDITPEMPIIQPDKGKRIRFGGNQKQSNSY